jgi:hypothetical protein
MSSGQHSKSQPGFNTNPKSPPKPGSINPKYASPDLKGALKMDTKEAAEYLGFAPFTLRRARTTGRLSGVPPPMYRRMGRKIVYEKQWLDQWLAQFEPQTSTAQNISNKMKEPQHDDYIPK